MQPDHQVSVSSVTDSELLVERAMELAEKLALPFCYPMHKCVTPFALVYSQKGLMLYQCTGTKKPIRLLFVDFVNGKNGYRLINDRSIKQPLARAVGVKSGFRPTVLDATAGLGGDAFVLASIGCLVSMSERSQIMATLLADGLERAAGETITSTIVHNNLQLYQSDGISILTDAQQPFYTVYLDPMYPHRKNSALNKQSMRVIRNLVGDDTDAETLFTVALKTAANRVVVKRPEKAPTLSKLKPSHVILMKNSRFDVYLTFNQS